jgi:hypothetical protein
MEYSLQYRSTRTEVWQWYLRAWRSKLWVLHAALSLMIAGLISSRVLPDSNLVILGMLSIALFPVVFLLFAAFPQLMFKSAERHLTLNEIGWTTTIGAKSGSRRWRDMASVDETPGALAIVSRYGKALIVPARALPNSDRWSQFVADVKAWHRAAAV